MGSPTQELAREALAHEVDPYKALSRRPGVGGASALRSVSHTVESLAVPGTKDTNPKDAIAGGKLPLHLVPKTLVATACLAFLNGAMKYGRLNWRKAGVRATVYLDAAQRHLDALAEGEDVDEEGVPHAASILACIGIYVDAQAAGKLTDDRNMAGGYRKLLGELTPHVARLKELHAGKNPHHYTVADNKGDQA